MLSEETFLFVLCFIESANETETEESETEKPSSAAAVDVHEVNDEPSTQDPVEDDALRTEL